MIASGVVHYIGSVPSHVWVTEVGSIPNCPVGSRKRVYYRVEGEAEVDMVKQ